MQKKILFILAIFLVIVVVLAWLSPKTINWEEHYKPNSKDPFGTYIFQEIVEDVFDTISIVNRNLMSYDDEVQDVESKSGNNLILVTKDFFPQEKEWNSLMEWVSYGNNVFIAASAFHYTILDTLNASIKYHYNGLGEITDRGIKTRMIDTVRVFSANVYDFDRKFETVYFEELYDSLPAIEKYSCLSDSDELIVTMSQDVGLGKIYLHSFPESFSNYYIVNGNEEYLASILSLMPNRRTLVDTYYKPGAGKSQPAMEVFMSIPSSKWAIYLGLALLALYILFKFKRTQRIIPIVKPLENRSLEFASTIGDLYFNSADARDLVEKMDRHYKEYIKENYGIYDYTAKSKDQEKLISKSGASLGLVSSIDTMLHNYKQFTASDKEILQLRKKLHQFYYGRK